MRQVAIDAASIPKDAKIAALEKNSAESEKLVTLLLNFFPALPQNKLERFKGECLNFTKMSIFYEVLSRSNDLAYFTLPLMIIRMMRL